MIGKRKIKSILSCVPLAYRPKILPVFLLSLVNVILDLLSIAYLLPFLMLAISDKSTILHRFVNIQNLTVSIVLLVAFFIAKNLVAIRIIRYQNKVMFDISAEISTNFAQSLLHENYLAYQNLDKGEIVKNTIEVPNNFVSNVLLSLITIFSDGVIIASIALVGLYFFPFISLLIAVTFTVLLLAMNLLRRLRLRAVSKSLSADYRSNVNHLLDLVNGFFEIRSSGTEREFAARFDASNRNLNRSYSYLSAVKISNAKYVEIIVICIISLLVLYLSKYASADVKILLITFMASVFFRLVPSLNRLIIASSSLKSYHYTIAAIRKNQKTTIEVSDSVFVFQSALHARNINFGYEGGEPLFENANFILKKGTIAGIKGRSGTGKTTFLHLLLKLIEPNSGEILLDGKPVAKSHSILRNTGYVTQDPFVFSGSIIENVALGGQSSEIDYDRIRTLAQSLAFDEVITAHEGGLNAATGHNGQKLSGGQKQKLALLRALYLNPQILILDEATNQLDRHNERIVLTFIRELVNNERLSVILISHDENVLEYCDMIYELENGSLNEV